MNAKLVTRKPKDASPCIATITIIVTKDGLRRVAVLATLVCFSAFCAGLAHGAHSLASTLSHAQSGQRTSDAEHVQVEGNSPNR